MSGVDNKPSPRPHRLVDISSDGRHLILRRDNALTVLDMRDDAAEQRIEAAGLEDFAVVGDTLWVVRGGDLDRYPLHGGARRSTTRLERQTGRLWPSREADMAGADTPVALWQGHRRMLLGLDGSVVRERRLAAVLDGIPTHAFVRPAGQRGLLVAHDRALHLIGFEGDDRIVWRLPATGRLLAAESLSGDRTVAALMEGQAESILLVLAESGAARYILHLPRIDLFAVADRSGIALVRTRPGEELMAVDLVQGKILARVAQPQPLAGMCLDRDARFLAMAAIAPGAGEGQHDTGHAREVTLQALRIPFRDLVHPAGSIPPVRLHMRVASSRDQAAEPPSGLLAVTPSGTSHDPGSGARPGASDPTAWPTAWTDIGSISMPTADLPPLLGLGRPYRTHRIPSPPRNAPPPYERADEHLNDLLEIAALRTIRAIIVAWHEGALFLPRRAMQDLPDARVRLLQQYTGPLLERDPGMVAQFDKQVFERHVVHVGMRTVTSLARQRLVLPFADLCYNLDLAYPAAQLLLMAAAPALRPDIARLFSILAGDEMRPLCDLLLIEQILSGPSRHGAGHAQRGPAPADDPAAAGTPAQAPDGALGAVSASLARLGLVRVLTAVRTGQCYTPLVVEPIALAYMRGQRFAGTGPDAHTSIHWAEHDLRALALPASVKDAAVVLLAHPRPDGRFHRVVLRGPAGSGRRSLAAALAGTLDKPVALIHCRRLALSGQPLAEALRRALLDAMVRCTIPLVSDLELLSNPMQPVRAVLRDHPGAVLVRTDMDFDAALEPDACSFVLPRPAPRSPAAPGAAARPGLPAGPVPDPAPAGSSVASTSHASLHAAPASAMTRPRMPAPRGPHDAAPPRQDCSWRTDKRRLRTRKR